MDNLHAPWRIEYITAQNEEGAESPVFKSIAQSSDDEANYVISRTHSSFALLNKFPYNGGHVLVVPYKRVTELDELTDKEILDLMKLVIICKQAIVRTMGPDGFNIGINLGRAAGAGVEDHLHIHIVPRWIGDVNFMPAIGQTAVLPEALLETASKLREALD